MRRALVAVVALLGLTAGIVVVGVVGDLVGRDDAPEGLALRYFSALEASDLRGALDQIVPEARAGAEPFVRNALGNRYLVTGVAAEYASFAEMLGGASRDARSLTVFVDITQADGTRWQAGPRVALDRRGGQWYLARPPLMPEGPGVIRRDDGTPA